MPKELTVEQMEFRNKVYEGIFWTSLALLFVWYLLKSFGVIKTPLWIELFPVVIAIFSAGTFFERIIGDIRTLKLDVGVLKTDVGVLKTDVGSLKARTDHLENDVHYVKSRV